MRNIWNKITFFFKANKVWIFSAIIALIAVLNYFDLKPFSKSKESYQLTVLVRDSEGNVAIENEGELNTSLGHRSFNKQIGVNGRTNFADVTEDNIGDSIKIGIRAEGWQIKGRNEFIFNGEEIRIIVEPNSSLGLLKGTVKSRDGQSFIGNVQIYVGADTMFLSESSGRFKIQLPIDMRVKSKKMQYSVTVVKEGYQTVTQFLYPAVANEVRLSKTELYE